MNSDEKFAKFNFLKYLNVDVEVIRRLSQLLIMTVQGKEDALLTPIAKEHTPTLLLSEFDKVFNANSHKMNDVLKDLESSNKAKFGPRSIAIPWKDRKSSLFSSFEAKEIDNIKDNLDYGSHRLRPLSLEQASKHLKNDTNSGLPYYIRKGLVKERVLGKFEELLKRKDPCILFTRTQEQGKTRNVWGYPIADTLNEMRYYFPLLSFQKKLSCRSALLGPDAVAQALTKLITEAVRTKQTLISVDFTAYDTSVKYQAQKIAFEYIKRIFQRDCAKDLEYIFLRFNEISILTPDGVIKGKHGVPSGSTFTNEVDSIVQMLISTNLPFIKEENFQVQGDDGVYMLPLDLVLELKNKFKSCGLQMNEDKSYLSSNYAIYLQNLYHIDYLKDGLIGGIYPLYRALNRILFQERWSTFEEHDISGKDYYSIRTICIVENCKYHPLYQEFVKFILKYDKYSLEVTDQGIANYIQMMSKTQGAGDVLINQFGDNVSGIRNFTTFKLIKELS